jgi:hypothetical protein
MELLQGNKATEGISEDLAYRHHASWWTVTNTEKILFHHQRGMVEPLLSYD